MSVTKMWLQQTSYHEKANSIHDFWSLMLSNDALTSWALLLVGPTPYYKWCRGQVGWDPRVSQGIAELTGGNRRDERA